MEYAMLESKPSISKKEIENFSMKLKKSVLQMGLSAGGGYIGQGIGSAEMISALFCKKLRLDAENPLNPNRDRFLLSTGHYAISTYAAMAELDLIPKELLKYYSADGTTLEMIGSEVTPGLEIGGGSLGQGLSRGVGHALTARLRNQPWQVYVYMSDGELQEGQVWEAAMVASHQKLDNLLLVIDYNGLQVEGKVEEITNMENMIQRWQAFGWNAVEINGNDLTEVIEALDSVQKNGKPTVIIAKTVIGNGISFLHGREDVHYVKWTESDHKIALHDIEEAYR